LIRARDTRPKLAAAPTPQLGLYNTQGCEAGWEEGTVQFRWTWKLSQVDPTFNMRAMEREEQVTAMTIRESLSFRVVSYAGEDADFLSNDSPYLDGFCRQHQEV